MPGELRKRNPDRKVNKDPRIVPSTEAVQAQPTGGPTAPRPDRPQAAGSGSVACSFPSQEAAQRTELLVRTGQLGRAASLGVD